MFADPPPLHTSAVPSAIMFEDPPPLPASTAADGRKRRRRDYTKCRSSRRLMDKSLYKEIVEMFKKPPVNKPEVELSEAERYELCVKPFMPSEFDLLIQRLPSPSPTPSEELEKVEKEKEKKVEHEKNLAYIDRLLAERQLEREELKELEREKQRKKEERQKKKEERQKKRKKEKRQKKKEELKPGQPFGDPIPYRNVHIYTRHNTTFVDGFEKEVFEKMLNGLKKAFRSNVNGFNGQVIELRGDKRHKVYTYLVQAGIVKQEHIVVHDD